MRQKKTRSHPLLDFANQYIEAVENPGNSNLQTDLIFKQECHRVLEAAVRALEQYRQEAQPEFIKEVSKALGQDGFNELFSKLRGPESLEVFDLPFFKHIESLRRRMKPRFVSYVSFGDIQDDEIERVFQPRLEWQLDPAPHPGNMAWYHLHIANFLSQPDLVSALHQCPWCRRLFLSTHSQKIYCHQRCSRDKALDEHILRKEVKDDLKYWKPSNRKRKVQPRPLAEKSRIGDLRKAKEKLEKEKILKEIEKESDPYGNL
jgi:hypothetical protein